jgi:predicted TIM-barrel enzyme
MTLMTLLLPQQHGVLLENMNDIPYLRPQHITPETVAVMTKVCSKVREIVPEQKPLGVQVSSSLIITAKFHQP